MTRISCFLPITDFSFSEELLFTSDQSELRLYDPDQVKDENDHDEVTHEIIKEIYRSLNFLTFEKFDLQRAKRRHGRRLVELRRKLESESDTEPEPEPEPEPQPEPRPQVGQILEDDVSNSSGEETEGEDEYEFLNYYTREIEEVYSDPDEPYDWAAGLFKKPEALIQIPVIDNSQMDTGRYGGSGDDSHSESEGDGRGNADSSTAKRGTVNAVAAEDDGEGAVSSCTNDRDRHMPDTSTGTIHRTRAGVSDGSSGSDATIRRKMDEAAGKDKKTTTTKKKTYSKGNPKRKPKFDKVLRNWAVKSKKYAKMSASRDIFGIVVPQSRVPLGDYSSEEEKEEEEEDEKKEKGSDGSKKNGCVPKAEPPACWTRRERAAVVRFLAERKRPRDDRLQAALPGKQAECRFSLNGEQFDEIAPIDTWIVAYIEKVYPRDAFAGIDLAAVLKDVTYYRQFVKLDGINFKEAFLFFSNMLVSGVPKKFIKSRSLLIKAYFKDRMKKIKTKREDVEKNLMAICLLNNRKTADERHIPL